MYGDRRASAGATRQVTLGRTAASIRRGDPRRVARGFGVGTACASGAGSPVGWAAGAVGDAPGRPHIRRLIMVHRMDPESNRFVRDPVWRQASCSPHQEVVISTPLPSPGGSSSLPCEASRRGSRQRIAELQEKLDVLMRGEQGIA